MENLYTVGDHTAVFQLQLLYQWPFPPVNGDTDPEVGKVLVLIAQALLHSLHHFTRCSLETVALLVDPSFSMVYGGWGSAVHPSEETDPVVCKLVAGRALPCGSVLWPCLCWAFCIGGNHRKGCALRRRWLFLDHSSGRFPASWQGFLQAFLAFVFDILSEPVIPSLERVQRFVIWLDETLLIQI